MEGPILLVGCGRMGLALLAGWRAAGLSGEQALVVEPDAALRDRARTRHGAQAFAEPKELPGELAPRAIVLAVKPQVMDRVVPAYDRLVHKGALVASIAAGKTIEGLAHAFGPGVPIVRAMPNTPAAVGRGASVLCANAACGEAHRALATALLQAVGEVFWIDDEELMHAVTAMSGGGPAYVFLLIEALATAGARAGLPEDLAMRLARATVIGSGELARLSDEPAEQLRKNVTSPGGTTAEALAVLMAEDGLQPLLDRAIRAAADRSRALA
jgi:pyrroline-5-carboxylate reductase